MYRKGFFRFSFVSILCVLVSACGHPFAHRDFTAYNELILANQLAYAPNAPKIALIRTQANHFSILNEQGKIVFSGNPTEQKYSPLSGDHLQQIDFSDLQQIGRYRILVNDSIYSHPFDIKAHPYREIAKTALKAFYLNRSGIEIEKAYAGKWARKMGHPDTLVYVHASAADQNHPEGSKISSPKGWYDAGDYNKYIVNSSISTYTLLLAYYLQPEYFKNQNLNIPESEDHIPDILNETLYNLRWMMSMQDEKDGGVYHKLTTKNFESFVMPDQAVQKRYVVQKSTAATLDFAATMAFASRIFNDFSEELPGLADSCVMQAQKAWQWALKNPEAYYRQPKDIKTGTYDDNDLRDEWYWAASELLITTQNKTYQAYTNKKQTTINTPSWDKVSTLGTISLLLNQKEATNTLREKFFESIDLFLQKEQQSPLRIAIDDFQWGSNSDFANQGMLKMLAYHLSKDKKYLDAAQEDMDYLLGRNATAYCFVTGFGSKSPDNIHHRISAADTILEAMPGLLVGGPNLIVPNDCGDEITRSEYPAKSYSDLQCSYSTNEIAINWNAPFVFLTSSLDAYENTKK